MKKMLSLIASLLYVLSFNSHSSEPLLKGESLLNLDQEFEWLEAEKYVITASKVKEKITKSPASVSVITSEQIKNMGAKDLMEVLNTVPGFQVFKGAYTQRVQIRGILKPTSSGLLLMINSHPVNNNFTGSGVWAYGHMSVKNIKRVEVIRGPGSALYGANAFSGIVNVITKSGAEIDSLEISTSYGSDSYKRQNYLHGDVWGDLEMVLNINFLETNGYQASVDRDNQFNYDNKYGTKATLAPGTSNNQERQLDMSLNLRFKDFWFDGRLIDHERGPNVGITDALNQSSEINSDAGYMVLGYSKQVTDNWKIDAKIYQNHQKNNDIVQFLPNGAFGLDRGLYADIVNKNTRTGIELQSMYNISDNNTLIFGATYEELKQFDVEYAANHAWDANGNIILAVPGILPSNTTIDLTDTQYNYMQPAKRTFKAFYLEDIWDVTEHLRLVIGGRYDDYSDFGGTFNPRAGLTWEYADGYDIKLLYGRAFRAPSFYELYTKHYFVKGNANLAPETVDTYELSFGARFTEDLKGRITGFYSKFTDVIVEEKRIVGGNTIHQFQNASELDIQGIEAELRYNFGRGSYLSASYTYQNAMDPNSEERVGRVPVHFGTVTGNYRFNKHLNWHSDLYWSSAAKKRADAGETTTYATSFMVVNTTLTAKEFCPGLENLTASFSVYNVFDEDYSMDYSQELPGGAPMPRRSYMIQLGYSF